MKYPLPAAKRRASSTVSAVFEPSSILVSTLVLTLRPTGLLPLVTDSLPVRLLPTELLSGTPIRSRDITLGDDPGINGQLWDPQRIDITAQQGTWERWTVRADRPQSFHIEGVMFQIRNVNGSSPFPEDRGWKDTVWVDGQVELLVYYAQPSWPHFPFQYLESDAGACRSRLDRPDAGESRAVTSLTLAGARSGFEKILLHFHYHSGL